MNKSAKILKVIMILLILAIAGCLTYKYLIPQDENSVNVSILNNTTDENNVVNNEIENNTTNSIENNIVENNTSSASNTKTMSNEEKAIQLVKDDWGSNDNVYIKIQSKESDYKYVISVSDPETTKVLQWYTVDVSTGKIEK